jgi:hypothetical protein
VNDVVGYEPKPVGEHSAPGERTAVRPRLTTTIRILIWASLLVAGVLALCAVPAANIGALRDGFGDIATRSGPGVVAAAHLYDDLADMDGRVATMLVVGDGAGQTWDDAYKAYQNDQTDAAQRLELLGTRIDAIPGGPAAYIGVENGLNLYVQEIAQAMYVDDQAHDQAAAAPPADALSRFQEADELMHRAGTGVLAEAQALVDDGRSTVDAAYYGAFGTIGQLRIWGILLTVFLVLALLVVQRELVWTFKRRVNPPLALATVLTIIFGVLLFSALDAAHADYVTQKADAFDSVVVLWQDRAVAADMNASESRWLLDNQSGTPASRVAETGEQSLFNGEEQFTASEPGDTEHGAQYAADLDRWTKTLQSEPNGAAAAGPATGFTDGYLATELANITFPGEQTAAVAAVRAYDVYIDDDGKYRYLVNGGTPAADAADYLNGQFAKDFAAYTAAIDSTAKIDQRQFAEAAEHGGDGLGPWLWMPAGWAVLTVALIVSGFLPRLREYRRF